MKFDKLTRAGFGDNAYYFHERDRKYGTAEWMLPAVVNPKTLKTPATPSSTTFAELIQSLDIIPGQLQMLQKTSVPGSSQMRLASQKPKSNNNIESLPPVVAPDLSQLKQLKPAEPGSFYPCIYCPKLMTRQKSDSDKEMVMGPASLEV